MLPLDQFKKFDPGHDQFYRDQPGNDFNGLNARDPNRPWISVMISTWNRLAQLGRSLECYARQTFTRFEILINDDGSTQPIKSLVDQFTPYLNIQYFHTPRKEWVSCPSRAYKMMMPHAQGDIFMITHPEMMLSNGALDFVYAAIYGYERDSYKYILNPKSVNDPVTEVSAWDLEGHWKWVSLRPGFIPEQNRHLSGIDWHSNVDNISKHPEFMSWVGFAAQTNAWHQSHPKYPWWFVGAASADCPIWEDMHETTGHGIIDMWLCGYRGPRGIVDVVPNKIMCYHQPHQTSAVAPMGEQESIT